MWGRMRRQERQEADASFSFLPQATERWKVIAAQCTRRQVQGPSVQDARKNKALPGSSRASSLVPPQYSHVLRPFGRARTFVSSDYHLLTPLFFCPPPHRPFSGPLKSAFATRPASSSPPSPPTNSRPSPPSSRFRTSPLCPLSSVSSVASCPSSGSSASRK